MLHFFIRKAVTQPKRLKSKVKGASKAKRVDALAKRMARAVELDLINGITTFKKRISAKKMQEAWESGQYESVDRNIPWDDLHGDLEPFKKTLGKAMFGASIVGFQQLPPPAKKNAMGHQ